MAWKTAAYRIRGSAPLLMHNARLADPMDEFVKSMKELTAKRKKVEADLIEIAHLEFLGGLYMGADGPIIPCDALQATLLNAAKKTKEGPAARPGMIVPDHAILEYDGPREPEKLWQDKRFRFSKLVRVSMQRVMRMRPIFPEGWEATISVDFEDTVTSKKRVDEWVVTGGQQIGLLDWRPRYGRYDVIEGLEKEAT